MAKKKKIMDKYTKEQGCMFMKKDKSIIFNA